MKGLGKCIFGMMMMLLLAKGLMAQNQQTKVIQFFGIVKQDDEGIIRPLGMVTIQVKGKLRATFSNPKGGFSIAVMEGDTIQFSHVGFKNKNYIVPKTINKDVLFSYMEIDMEQDYFELPEYAAKALPTKAQFERDFVNMKVDEDLTSIASNNISSRSLEQLLYTTPSDGSEAVGLAIDQQMNNFTNFKQGQSVQLFNPFAWANFIKQLKSGEIKLR